MPKPMTWRAAFILDNPLRRFGNNPQKLLARVGLKPGMTVLEVGCGPGFFTIPAAKALGESGLLYAVDIQEQMLAKLAKKIAAQGLFNIHLIHADAAHLDLSENLFDLVFMVAVLGEIPNRAKALQEFYRLLKPGGIISFVETLPDFHYLRRKVVKALSLEAGFKSLDYHFNPIYAVSRFAK